MMDWSCDCVENLEILWNNTNARDRTEANESPKCGDYSIPKEAKEKNISETYSSIVYIG